MGKRSREAVKEWAKAHPMAPDPEEALKALEPYVGKGPSPKDLEAFARMILAGAKRASEPIAGISPSGESFTVTPPQSHAFDRFCFRCNHPVSEHQKDSDCGCCSKGIKIIRPGTDLFRLALEERKRR